MTTVHAYAKGLQHENQRLRDALDAYQAELETLKRALKRLEDEVREIQTALRVIQQADDWGN